jgi:glycosyltransferase involved in cell wall biosynthesis
MSSGAFWLRPREARLMRVLFLTLYPESAASPRYRVHQFLPHLRERGVTCEVACPFTEAEYVRLRAKAAAGRARSYHLHEARVRALQILRAGRYDVVFMQKAVMSAYVRGFATQLRQRARRLVYDIDDAVHLRSPHKLPRRWEWLEEPDQVNRLFLDADLVLAGNRWLADAALACGGRAEFFPTVVDTERFAPAANANEKFVIGWMGGPSTSANLATLAEVLGAIPDCEVRLIGADPVRAAIDGAWHRPWRYETEVAELQQFSIGIMPLGRTDWDRGKCGLKVLQYMACGVPCIATRCDVTMDMIEHERTGFLVDSPDEWRAAIENLRDPELRARIARAGREAVEGRFSLKVAAPKLVAHLEAVVK